MSFKRTRVLDEIDQIALLSVLLVLNLVLVQVALQHRLVPLRAYE